MAREVKFKDKMLPLAGPQLKPGDAAPDFACVTGLEIVKLGNTPAKTRLFSVVPSLDTPVAVCRPRNSDEPVSAIKDKVACYTVSLDLPFAMKRFCEAEGITNLQSLSDLHDQSFGKNYGVLIQGLPIPLLSRRSLLSIRATRSLIASMFPKSPASQLRQERSKPKAAG